MFFPPLASTWVYNSDCRSFAILTLSSCCNSRHVQAIARFLAVDSESTRNSLVLPRKNDDRPDRRANRPRGRCSRAPSESAGLGRLLLGLVEWAAKETAVRGVLVTIRHDSDADGLAEATDEVVAGATVEIVITGPTGGTFTGVTDGSGVFTTASSRYCVLRLLTARFFVRVQVPNQSCFPSRQSCRLWPAL